MEDFDDQQQQISKYNDAGLSISRLHDSWIICKQCIRSGNFRMWKIELDNIWMELITDIFRQINKETLINKNRKLMIDISKAKRRNEIFFTLMERHTFLRECQDIAGKAGVYRDENEEGFE